MAYYNDEVTLTLNGKELRVATGFDIHQSIIHQPSIFSFTLGQQKEISDFIKATPNNQESDEKENRRRALTGPFGPNAPFELRINGNLRMSGNTDGYRASASGGAGTELSIFGRDGLAPLHDAHVHYEVNFKDSTYRSLVAAVLELCGIDPKRLTTSSSAANADRQLRAGIPVRELSPVRTVQEILAAFAKDDPNGGSTAGATHYSLQSKIGERWMEFLRKQLDRAGLFLWSGGDNQIILGAPNVNTAPLYKIIRKRGQVNNEVNVEHADLLFDTRPMNTFAIVYGRAHGKKGGRPPAIGDSADDLMYNMGFPISRAIAIRDKHCKSKAQAAYLAQRKLAEGRRHGYQLVYTLSGLSTPAIGGGRAIWTPDTTVEVDDDEFGIKETFWIESVEMSRKPQTITTIRLMRTYDAVFAAPEFGDDGSGGGGGGFDTPNVVRTVEEILEEFRKDAAQGKK